MADADKVTEARLHREKKLIFLNHLHFQLPIKWPIYWRWYEHGFYPPDYHKLPIPKPVFEYWHIGPFEIRRIIIGQKERYPLDCHDQAGRHKEDW